MPTFRSLVPRRFFASVAAVLLLVMSASVARAQSAQSQDASAEPTSKNYSLPWVATLIGLAAIVVPVALATHRKWDMPFDDEDDS